MTSIVNLTPHAVTVGDVTYPPSGDVARVSVDHIDTGHRLCGQPIYRTVYGDVVGVPPCAGDGVFYIVSKLVVDASPDRFDLVAPASGHPDVVRNDKGHIVSVPGFVVA